MAQFIKGNLHYMIILNCCSDNKRFIKYKLYYSKKTILKNNKCFLVEFWFVRAPPLFEISGFNDRLKIINE